MEHRISMLSSQVDFYKANTRLDNFVGSRSASQDTPTSLPPNSETEAHANAITFSVLSLQEEAPSAKFDFLFRYGGKEVKTGIFFSPQIK